MPVISGFSAGRNVKINGVSSLELKATGGLEGNQIGSTYTIDGSNKQDKLSGTKGQLVGFDESGNAIAQEAPNGLPDGGSPGQILTKTAEGEAWQDAPDTGVKTFNGRSDDVMPQSGDYTAEMVGARPSTWVPTAAEVGADAAGAAQAVQSSLDTHAADTTKHITAAERQTWNGKANASHTHAASDITSRILSVARGGTGRSSLTSGYFLRGNGTGIVTLTSLSALKSELGISSSKTYQKMSQEIENISMSQNNRSGIYFNFDSSIKQCQSYEVRFHPRIDNYRNWDEIVDLTVGVGGFSGASVSIQTDYNSSAPNISPHIIIRYLSFDDEFGDTDGAYCGIATYEVSGRELVGAGFFGGNAYDVGFTYLVPRSEKSDFMLSNGIWYTSEWLDLSGYDDPYWDTVTIEGFKYT